MTNQVMPIWMQLNEQKLVCEEWRVSYKQFKEDVGNPISKNCKLVRINDNEPYSKENFKWVELSEDEAIKFNQSLPSFNQEFIQQRNLNHEI